MTDRLTDLTVQSASSVDSTQTNSPTKSSHHITIHNSAHEQQHQRSFGSGVYPQNENDSQPDESLQPFHEEMDAIKQAITSMHEYIKTIDEQYKHSLNKSLTAEDRQECASEITSLVNQTGSTSQAIRKRLRRIAEENNTFAENEPTKTSAIRIRIATHQAVTSSFMGAMQKFEDTQERHRDAVRAAVETQLRLMNPDAPDEDIQAALQRGEISDVNSIVDNSPLLYELPVEEQNALRTQLETLTSRNNDIRDLEQSIVNLHEMFMDMQLLVDKQGDLLNTIEYNVQETKGKAEEGMHQLVEAHDFQRQANKKKWCIAMLIVAVILVITVPILIKYIPIWLPDTADTISQIPILGDGTSASPTPLALPDAPERNLAHPGHTTKHGHSPHPSQNHTAHSLHPNHSVPVPVRVDRLEKISR